MLAKRVEEVHETMSKKLKIIIPIVVLLGVIGIGWFFLHEYNFPVLNPKGTISKQQLDLIIFATLLMLVVVVPVFVLTFFIVWKYRATNTDARYSPDWDHNNKLEALWWGLPLLIITILSVVIWKTSHSLDPYKPLASSTPPITVQVVALEWKWLFLYPEQGIASVNALHIPENTPINFKITADAPMNSFWIPNLGGQVYAMAGMETKLHLQASEQGIYEGSSANISGEGFASMRFNTTVTSRQDFDAWVNATQHIGKQLAADTYTELSEPSSYVAPAYYSSFDHKLYDTIIMKYMEPGMADNSGEHSEHHH